MKRFCFLAMLLMGCSTSAVTSTGDLRGAGQECLKSAEAWLAKPEDKRQLQQAIATVESAKASVEKDKQARGKAVYADIELLSGALNMARLGLDDGQDPTKPSSMSEVPTTHSVKIVLGRLRSDLAIPDSAPSP